MDTMFFENRSKYGFEETINQLTELVPENEWKIIKILDLQETMRKNGKDVLPVKVVEMCKPDYAYQLLSEDSQRIYSNMMPCRVSVYEKSDGNTYISRMNSAMFAEQIGGVMQDVMSKAFDDVEKMIKKITIE
ncbi:MAG: DUF302 domain-containing protein [Bacteroidales bacterium]|nr:DUF302 domain-containing protein [Bacteroidales bacterium]